MLKTNICVNFRAGRHGKEKVPTKYPATAWYSYTDQTCFYNCQAIEYIWWGYCSFTGICAGRSGNARFEAEFKYLKKSQLVNGDKPLTKLFTDSATSTVYKLPTKYVDGTYTGCNTCATGTNHGGS